jgi:hypothetical protein
MPNLLQIKRSATNATPVGLANGELAYTSNGDVLYIGSPNGSVIGIGGARFPGTLTANQALVANSTSGINEIRVGTANVGAIYANGSLGTAGQILSSNSTGVYWADSGSLGINTAAQYTWSNLNTFQANLHVGNNTVNSQFSNAYILLANATSTTVVSLADIRVGNTAANVIISNTGSTFGANVTVTSGSFFLGNAVYLSTVNASLITVGTLPWAQAPANTVNTSGSFTFTGLETFQANLHVGNAAVNSQFSNGSILLTNATSTTTVGLADIRIGNTSSNITLSNTGSTFSGNITVTSGSFFVGNGIYLTTVNASLVNTGTLAWAQMPANTVNTSGSFTFTGLETFQANLHTGNASVNTQLSNSTILISNATSTTTVGLADIRVGNTTTNVIISNTGSTFGGNVTMSGANTNITGYLAAANGIFSGSVTISGNLFVNGTTTQIDTTSLLVKDNFVQLADQLANTATFLDNVDIGLFVQTGNTGAGAVNYYSGLGRIAANSSNTNPYFKLFSTQTLPNSTIIDTAATTGTLQAFLAPWGSGGAFVVNSTVVNITANGTVSSTITANSLTLTTALVGTSGGTGKSTVTNNAILVGNATNGYNELTLGTADKFLQSNGTALVYSANLDGGSF